MWAFLCCSLFVRESTFKFFRATGSTSTKLGTKHCRVGGIHQREIIEMAKITNRNQSRNIKKNNTKMSAWRNARTHGYTRSGIMCLGGISMPCCLVTPAVSKWSETGKRNNL